MPIFSTLRIFNLGNRTAEINTTKIVILTITTIITIMVVKHGEESVICVVKKIVALASIQMMSNRR